jgi:hypothetical protein
VSPFWGIEKSAVLQDARCFNDSQLDARKCQQASLGACGMRLCARLTSPLPSSAAPPQVITKLLYLDSDVVLANSDPDVHWYDAVSALLDHADVLHPGVLSGYLDVLQTHATQLRCSVVNATRGHALENELLRVQTGMAWAFRRAWLQSVGGLFDYAVFGGGDVLNAAAFAKLPVCLAKHTHADAASMPYRNCSGLHAATDGSYEELYAEWWHKVGSTGPVLITSQTLLAIHSWHGVRHSRWAEPQLLSNANVSHVGQILVTNEDGIWVYRNNTRKGNKLNKTICSFMHDPHSAAKKKAAEAAVPPPEPPPTSPGALSQPQATPVVSAPYSMQAMLSGVLMPSGVVLEQLPPPAGALQALREQAGRLWERSWKLLAAVVLLPLAALACCLLRVGAAVRRRRGARAGGRPGGSRSSSTKADREEASMLSTLFPRADTPWKV